jgi:hypothetical protein
LQRQISVKIQNMKFHENLSGDGRVVPCGQDSRAVMMRLVIATCLARELSSMLICAPESNNHLIIRPMKFPMQMLNKMETSSESNDMLE